MDAILFHPETSIRRALILALGTYGTDGSLPGEREPLVAKLLDLYHNDPDAGIHGAAEWTLRQWKQDREAQGVRCRADASSRTGQPPLVRQQPGPDLRRDRRPCGVPHGLATNEPDRDADETPHRRVIPRRFAIANKEVTVEQYQRFVEARTRNSASPQNYLDKYSPDPDGPMIAVTWFGAAAYCNWLSKQEGLPKDQWCYLPNEQREYAAGMTIPADVLERTGYRLPTEAEWEYACRAVRSRAGIMVSRPTCSRLMPGMRPIAGTCLARREPAAQRSGLVRHAGERV